jgi:hypothetical protein
LSATLSSENIPARRREDWGKEPGLADFSEFNNCKDPRFR